MSKQRLVLIGDILNTNLELTITELVHSSSARIEIVIELVEEGVLEPQGNTPEQWLFTGRDLMRIRRALNLKRDLKLNLPGIALAIDLLEELDELRSKVDQLERR